MLSEIKARLRGTLSEGYQRDQRSIIDDDNILWFCCIHGLSCFRNDYSDEDYELLRTKTYNECAKKKQENIKRLHEL